ncbi:unnamed protein product [Adineta steineri]|uniref:Uncharacterized protein n=1 Tax=Adineta steineri TaxID=433720 RepID=A0A814BE22_9BILA|nr:unnamed protein product [Adineta steineri]CAF3806143.1 unnamed protein product [Adineta steineri]
MTVLYDNSLSTKPLPKSQTLIFDSHITTPSKLNIKLKTHSLSSLNIPLETCVNFKQMSSLQTKQQKILAGSVDSISETQHSNDDIWNHFSSSSSSTSLINISSSNKQLPIVQQEWRQILKERFHISNSFITSTSFNDSIVRLRRNHHFKNIHQSSLQTIDKIPIRKRRFSFNYHESIPKFTFRDLPSSNSRPTSSINQFEQSSKRRMSQFISLPEIRSFNEKNSFDSSSKVKLSQLPRSSWKKSNSWSWKSNIKNKEIQRQIDDHFHSNLPVIIESPLQQRSNMYHSNLSFSNEKTQQRLNKKISPFPHSISNYDVSPNLFSSQSKIHYPSTPVLTHSHNKNFEKFNYQRNLSSIPVMDDADDCDSTLSDSSFRSCINSMDESFEDPNTDSSSVSDSYFQEFSSIYDLPRGLTNETIKHSRLSFRHICTLQ